MTIVKLLWIHLLAVDKNSQLSVLQRFLKKHLQRPELGIQYKFVLVKWSPVAPDFGIYIKVVQF